MLQSFPINLHDIVETFSCNSSESDCMLDRCPIWKSWVIIEILVSNEEEAESDTSIDTTDESSDDSSDKCDVTFYLWQTLQKRITKSKIDVCLTMQYICSKKI